jgi:hypothetical protein
MERTRQLANPNPNLSERRRLGLPEDDDSNNS